MSWQDHPDCPADGERLCRVDEIPDQNGREVCFGSGKENFKILLLRQGQLVWSYLNYCPHMGRPLNFAPGRFLLKDDEEIFCAFHYACFRIEDGYCTDGPCRNYSLGRFEAKVENGEVFIGEELTWPEPRSES